MSRAAILAMMSAGEQARFKAVANQAGASTTVSFSGMVAGDLCVIFAQGDFSTPALSGGSGWATISPANSPLYGYISRIFSKVLTSGDISTGNVIISNANTLTAVAYANATSIAARSFTESGATASTLVLPALALAANSAGVLFFISAVSDANTYAAPAQGGLAVRFGPATANQFNTMVADFTTPGDYPEQALTWTGFDATAGQMGHVLELLQ